jgi:diaminopimelate decarboxylase/aspartate kinase
MTTTSHERWVVLKFGGTSVSSRERWDTILHVAQARIEEGLRPFIVCSALSGISDMLENVLEKAPKNEHEPLIQTIYERHRTLAAELGLSADTLLKQEFDMLNRLSLGASLIGEVSPRMHAQVLALGELMSTRLGSAYLQKQGLPSLWLDSRKYLRSKMGDHFPEKKRYLSASCDFSRDSKLLRRLTSATGKAVVAQGFIASDMNGATALLGRGGSDTSATYFAAKLTAERCEIWTDVPGVFSANPAMIPSAILLKRLSYDEAQEIMSTGAKVLHPRCIHPMKITGIPLHIRSTKEPDKKGTVISAEVSQTDADLKAISTKRGITLVSMESINMWQEVGFLADIATCFKNNGLSIDSVSTSETNVTVSLDSMSNVLDKAILTTLQQDLSRFCKVKLFEGCALISLVGRNIRSILHKLGPTFEVFGEKKIYLLTQASNDLNLSFIVDEEEAERVVRELHALLFTPKRDERIEQASDSDIAPIVPDEQRRPEQIWWKRKQAQLLELAQKATPLYVYDEETLTQMIRALKGLSAVDQCLYAIKANWNADILRVAHKLGMGFECVSPGEIAHLMRLFPSLKKQPERVLFTPNFAPRDDYAYAFKTGVLVTLDNLYPLQHWPELFKDREVFVRLDPGVGKGHHEYVRTAGVKSKFGVVPSQIMELKRLTRECGAKIVGLHAHTGSGILSSDTWQDRATFLVQVASEFPDVRILDLGGGLGIPEKPGEATLDMDALNQSLLKIKSAYPKYSLWLEPGRYVVAQSGVLLAKATQTKPKGDTHYVGVDTGMNALIRPALYGAFHEIVNLSRLDEKPTMTANVVGPICETGDTLGYNRRLAPVEEGDILLIGTAGAYGRVMSSEYNMRKPPEELLLRK